MFMYHDSLSQGEPDLKHLFDAIDYSLSSLGYFDKLRILARKANRYWVLLDKAQTSSSRQYAKEKLTQLGQHYRQYINIALFESGLNEQDDFSYGTNFAPDVIMIADR